MYTYKQHDYFGEDFVYAYNILDGNGNRICEVYSEMDAKSLIAALNREER